MSLTKEKPHPSLRYCDWWRRAQVWSLCSQSGRSVPPLCRWRTDVRLHAGQQRSLLPPAARSCESSHETHVNEDAVRAAPKYMNEVFFIRLTRKWPHKYFCLNRSVSSERFGSFPCKLSLEYNCSLNCATHLMILKLAPEHIVSTPSPEPTRRSPVFSIFIAFTPWQHRAGTFQILHHLEYTTGDRW